MFCSNCGKELPVGALFCNLCGQKVKRLNQPQTQEKPASHSQFQGSAKKRSEPGEGKEQKPGRRPDRGPLLERNDARQQEAEAKFVHVPEPVPEPAFAPAAEPKAKPIPAFTPADMPKADPISAFMPAAMPKAEPIPAFTPAAAPKSEPIPAFTPAAAPKTEPIPVFTPAAAPKTEPIPVFTPAVEPKAEPIPEPAPQPEPTPEPKHEPDEEPDPAFRTNCDPFTGLELEPEPAPQPEPVRPGGSIPVFSSASLVADDHTAANASKLVHSGKSPGESSSKMIKPKNGEKNRPAFRAAAPEPPAEPAFRPAPDQKAQQDMPETEALNTPGNERPVKKEGAKAPAFKPSVPQAPVTPIVPAASTYNSAADMPTDQPAFPPQPVQELPVENQPLSAWEYFGYRFLFSLPVIGLIMLIVFTFFPGNVNRTNFIRSYWYKFVLVMLIVLLVLILILTGALKGPINSLAEWFRTTGSDWLVRNLGQ